MSYKQCDQVELFFKKVAKTSIDFWAILKNITIEVKTPVAHFWVAFGKNVTFLFHNLITLLSVQCRFCA